MKRIKLYNRGIGQYVALTKKDIAMLLDMIANLSCATSLYKHLTYKEMVQMLHKQMVFKLPTYIGLIKWEGYI